MFGYPFENLIKKIDEEPIRKPVYVPSNFDAFSIDAFKQKIQDIENIPEENLAIIIRNYIDTISDGIINYDQFYNVIFRNPKFVSAFKRAVSYIPIDYKKCLACNKITYDYFTSDNPDSRIKKDLLDVSKIANKNVILRLINRGLPEEVAANLALSRYSSSHEITNVKRLNFSMYFRDPNLMTEQRIVWIYEEMFNKISDLFFGTMFEVYTQEQQDDFGDNFIEVYGTVGNAVLLILNNMTSEKIQTVLRNYSSEWVYSGRPPVRFSLRCLSEDYSKINRVVNRLEQEQIIIP